MNLIYTAVLVASGAVVPFVRPLPSGGDALHDETELVRDAIAGQRSAQHALYVRHYDRVHTRIARLLGRSSEVDDVLQDTFVAAFRDLETLGDATRFGSWVCGIAVHQVHRRLRRRHLLSRLGFVRGPDEPTLHHAVDPKAGPETQLLVKQLDEAILLLAPRQRLAWILRYVEGCQLEEVAEHCKTSLSTTKRDLAHAEAHLNAWFDNGSKHAG